MQLNHFTALMLFAVVVSIAFAFLSKRRARERVRYAVQAFLGFVLVAVVVAWGMYLLSR